MIDKETLTLIIKYIISILVQNKRYERFVKYVTEKEIEVMQKQESGYVYIVKSNFFCSDYYGKKNSLPSKPLAEYRGEKIFYGHTKEIEINGNIIIYSDLVASAYFVLTRYEEMINDKRDEYGNFPASESLLVQEGIIFKPVVDHYGRLLRELLRIMGHDISESTGFSKFYFTHDIDIPFNKYKFGGMVKEIGKSLLEERRLIIHPLLNYLGIYCINPKKTWDYMIKKEMIVKSQTKINTESISFIIASEKADKYTVPYIRDKKTKLMIEKMKLLGATIGMHASFNAAENAEEVETERRGLSDIIGEGIYYQRNHFLRQIKPYDYVNYEKAGFTDDFTTGFNEVVGFRLGTCHPIYWIDPRDGRISNFILHGMQIMDGSLIGPRPYQMGLSYEEAKSVCKDIVNEIYSFNGEIDVLFHNGMFENKPGNYIRELYDWFLEYVMDMVIKR